MIMFLHFAPPRVRPHPNGRACSCILQFNCSGCIGNEGATAVYGRPRYKSCRCCRSLPGTTATAAATATANATATATAAAATTTTAVFCAYTSLPKLVE